MGLFGFMKKKKKKEEAKKASSGGKKKAPAKSSGKSSSASTAAKKPSVKKAMPILKEATLQLNDICSCQALVSGVSINSISNNMTVSGILVDQNGCYYDRSGRPIEIRVTNGTLFMKYCSEPTPYEGKAKTPKSRKVYKINDEDTIDVPSGVVIDTDIGDVYLSAIDGDKLHYRVVGSVDGVMKKAEASIDGDGQLVLEYKVEEGSGDDKIDIYVELPMCVYNTLAVATNSGDIDATNISGAYFIDYRVSTSSGDIDLTNDCVFSDNNITFGSANFSSASGDMELKLSITDNDGNHYLINKLIVSTASGDVEIAVPALDTIISTNSGDVSYGDCFAQDIKITTTSGDVEISPTFFSEGDISIITNSGDIEVTGYGVGRWVYRGEGDVDDLRTDGKQTVHLSIITSSGDIDFD